MDHGAHSRTLASARRAARGAVVVFVAGLGCVGHASGQADPAPGRLAADLEAAGFDDVAVREEAGRWVVAFETDRFRDEAQAVLVAASRWDAHRGHADTGVLLLRRDGVPVVAARLPPRTAPGGETPDATFDTAAAVGRVRGASATAPGRRHLDVTLGPEVRAVFGDFSDPVRLRADAAVVAGLRLRAGLRAEAEVLVPLWNELEPGGGVVRPGRLALHQVARLGPATFAAVSLGRFRLERAGVDALVVHHLAGARWSVGARVGQTWASPLGDEGASPDARWTAEASLGHRWDGLDLWATATAGRFLQGDEGVVFDVRRAFGEIEIGFYGVRAGGESNGGFSVVLPIPRPASVQRGPVRLRPAPRFDWAYRYRGARLVGGRVETGVDVTGLLQRAHPGRIRRMLAASPPPR